MGWTCLAQPFISHIANSAGEEPNRSDASKTRYEKRSEMRRRRSRGRDSDWYGTSVWQRRNTNCSTSRSQRPVYAENNKDYSRYYSFRFLWPNRALRYTRSDRVWRHIRRTCADGGSVITSNAFPAKSFCNTTDARNPRVTGPSCRRRIAFKLSLTERRRVQKEIIACNGVRQFGRIRFGEEFIFTFNLLRCQRRAAVYDARPGGDENQFGIWSIHLPAVLCWRGRGALTPRFIPTENMKNVHLKKKKKRANDPFPKRRLNIKRLVNVNITQISSRKLMRRLSRMIRSK